MAQTKRTARPRPKTPSRVKKRRPRGARRREHHHPELIGLALVAAGVFLACVLWFGLNGGPLADWADDGVGWAAYLAPVVLIPVGALIVTRSELVSVRPFRLGLVDRARRAAAHARLRARRARRRRPRVGLRARARHAPARRSSASLLTIAGVLFLTGASLGALVQPLRPRRPPRLEPRPPRARRARSPSRTGSATTRRSLPPRDAPAPEPPVDVAQDYPDIVGRDRSRRRSSRSSARRRRGRRGDRGHADSLFDAGPSDKPRLPAARPLAAARSRSPARARTPSRSSASPRCSCSAWRTSASRRPSSARSPARA